MRLGLAARKSRRFSNAILAACVFSSFIPASAGSPNTPNFFARRDYLGLHADWIQVADTNRDGIPDLIASLSGYVEVLFGNGDGTFRAGPNTLTVASLAYRFVATDLTGAGTVDLVFSTAITAPNYPVGMAVSLGNGDGTFQTGVFYEVPDTGIFGLATGDFNGDGMTDVAVVGSLGVWLFTGKGGGAFNPGILAVPLSGGRNIATADFNQDHNLDLAVTCCNSQVAVLLGNGNGKFERPRTIATLQGAGGLAVGKLTKDGYQSIAVAGSSSKGVGVYLYYGNGTGGFSGPTLVNLPGASGLAINDINNDGIPDLVSSGGYIAYGTASGKFRAPVY